MVTSEEVRDKLQKLAQEVKGGKPPLPQPSQANILESESRKEFRKVRKDAYDAKMNLEHNHRIVWQRAKLKDLENVGVLVREWYE